MDEYLKQARDFLNRANATLAIKRTGIVDRFPGDDEPTGKRYKYRCRLSREGKSYTFNFYGSIVGFEKGEYVNEYDVLATMVKSDPGTFKDFCREYGYEQFDDEERLRNKKSLKIYKAVCKEWDGLCRVFDDFKNQEIYDKFCEIW